MFLDNNQDDHDHDPWPDWEEALISSRAGSSFRRSNPDDVVFLVLIRLNDVVAYPGGRGVVLGHGNGDEVGDGDSG